ncbi:MAG: TerC family protein [Coriobacteriia bacterium]
MDLLEIFSRPESWAAVATLTLLEIVLGIDNIVFIAIITARLPRALQPKARRTGLAMALGSRLLLLLTLAWVVRLDRPLISIAGFALSGKGIILLGGGLFLIAKSTLEIYRKTEMREEEETAGGTAAAFGSVVAQIALLDVIFSLDSVITAVGMVKELPLMVTAVLIAMGVMMVFADGVSEFINRHPSLKILALAFLMLIGVLLIAEGTGHEFDRAYVYFAMVFSLLVELVNVRYRANVKRHALSAGERLGDHPL